MSADTSGSKRYAIPGGALEAAQPLPLPEVGVERAGEALRLVLAEELEVPEGARCVHEVTAPVLLRVEATPEGLWITHDGCVFELKASDNKIRWCRVMEGVHPLALILEQVVGPLRAQWLRGWLGVHASAVSVGGRGWLFVGASGVGKSTTARMLVRDRGARLVSDDLALIEGGETLRLWPSASAVRLWREALPEAVGSLEVGGLREGKRWFRLPPASLEPGAVALAGVVLLTPEGVSEAPGLVMERVRGGDAAAALLTHALDFNGAAGSWRVARFRAACRVAREAPVWRARYARDRGGAPTHVEGLWRALGGS